MSQIIKKFLAADAVDESKIKLSNNGAIRARNAADSADVDLIKLNASDEAELSTGLNMGGNAITNVGNVDGRDVSADGAALDSHLDGGASKHDATEVDYERTDGSKVDIQAASDDVETALTDLDDRKLSVNGANAMAANLAMGSNKITGLTDGTAASDAATVGQVQAASAGQLPKEPVTVVSTANITLSGEQTIDGVLTSTSRILVAGQTNSDENGIYVTAAGAWARAADHDGNPDGEVARGNTTLVLSGTQNANTVYIMNATDAVDPTDITPGSESQEWIVYSRAESTTAGDGLTKSGLEFSVNTTDIAGTGLENDGSNNLRIAAAAAGDGIQGGGGSALSLDLKASAGLKIDTGELAVEPADFAGNGLEDNGSDQLQLDLKASGGLKFDTGEVAVEPADFAGTGLEDDGSDNLRLAAQGNGIAGGAGSTLSVNAGDSGAANLADVISVESAGISVRVDESTIQENGSSQLEVKDGGITEAKLDSGVDANTFAAVHTAVNYTPSNSQIDGHLAGIDTALASAANTNNKESFTLNGTDITNQYIDLANVAKASSIDFLVKGGPMQIEGTDYTVNLTGGAGGNTRLTFAGDLATSGAAELESGDIIIVKYQY